MVITNAPRTAHGPSRLRKADRKRQLLSHARKLFITFGYHHTTTEKIAHAAGISEPVLYRHFESKKALFLEVLQDISQTTLSRWYAESALKESPAERLRALIGSQFGRPRDQDDEFRLMHRTLIETSDPEITDCLRRFYLACEEFLSKLIAASQEAGTMRADVDIRTAAWEILRSCLAFSLTLPIGIPLYLEQGYALKATDCVLRAVMMPPQGLSPTS